ncbi:MAG: Type III restriction enzyme, res subunit [bacterium ADurb.Bin429]|nr:MAG: Type III restriction enzyme, res subunit [bacterium ADurb.Bin429]
MITLKDYQERVLESLRDFLRQSAHDNRPEAAFRAVQLRTGRNPMRYLPVEAEGLEPGMPYVCLRVPTGGGKTLLACHAAGIAMTDLLRADRAVVLWLVPSNTILDQTADALRDPRHPYRRALEMACGSVEVVTIEEALHLSRGAVDGQTVVIVSTIQSFRVEDTTGRKVYAQNGAFAEHLLNVPLDRVADLLPGPDGKPLPSLVNMLRLRRPIVIVDEAHNARTDLSFATLGALRPSCIIEFTATPARTKHPSNVLHHVSAAELKAAEMVKLPLRVITRHPSQRDQLLAEALTLREDLERLAITEGQQTCEYLRPILLIQAERVDDCVPLRDRLAADFGVPTAQIKISTGKLDELKAIEDISTQACPVRVIITVEKLREGWDCPFAYVLCSLKETRSATAIEQIVGRILRLPRASTKLHPELNCAYAFSVSDSLPDVLKELQDALVRNGFTAAEAEQIVIANEETALANQPISVHIDPATELDPQAAHVQIPALGGKVQLDAATGEVTILAPLDAEETRTLVSCATTPAAKAKIQDAADRIREARAAYGGGQTATPTAVPPTMDFRVPLLCVREGSDVFEFESTMLLEHPWKLSEKDALLPDYDPSKLPAARTGTLDIGADGNVKVGELTLPYETDFITKLHQQVFQLDQTSAWSAEDLIAWLDRHIDHRDIPYGESAAFLRKAVRGIMSRFGIEDVSRLALDRFRLRDAIDRRIADHRLRERREAFQLFLLPDSALTVSDAHVVDFTQINYDPSWLYDGSYEFRKHFFGPKPGELQDQTPVGKKLTEECRCAQYLDSMRAVECWVRNLSRRPTSFRLQTSTDWFYPDFVCKLTDGRILVVEYKGADRYTQADAEEKRAIGAVWAARSGGRCLFIMPTDRNFIAIDQLIASL